MKKFLISLMSLALISCSDSGNDNDNGLVDGAPIPMGDTIGSTSSATARKLADKSWCGEHFFEEEDVDKSTPVRDILVLFESGEIVIVREDVNASQPTDQLRGVWGASDNIISVELEGNDEVLRANISFDASGNIITISTPDGNDVYTDCATL